MLKISWQRKQIQGNVLRHADLPSSCPCCIGCVFGKSARGAVWLGEVGVEGSCDMNGSRCRVDSLARLSSQLYELSAAGDKQCLIVRHSPSAGRGQRGGGNERRVEAPPHAPRQRP